MKKKLNKKFDEALKKLKNMSFEEFEKHFQADTRPHGWLNIEDYLPECYVQDFVKQGYSIFKVRDKDGNEFESKILDHNTWYYDAKKQGITHWWNEQGVKDE